MSGGRIFLSAPDVRAAEVTRLAEAVASRWVAPIGPDLDAFEAEVAVWCGRPHGVGLSSGTAALHLALLAVHVERGDVVVVQSFTFAATANAVAYVGAEPVFVDSEATTWNADPDLVARAIAAARAAGKRVGAVVAVDLYGRCAAWDRLAAVCAEAGVPLVEDAAEALGSVDPAGRRAGSFGALAVMSFNGNKIITTSGGGMLLCDDEATAARARHLATQARMPAAHYEHEEVGFNYRLSNLLAAFGRGQLDALPERIARRREIRAAYVEALAGRDGVDVVQPPAGDNAWLTCVLVDPAVAGFDREALRLHLEAHDVESRPLWKPLHRQPVWRDATAVLDGTSDGLFEVGLCLPSGSGMGDADLQRVLDALDTIEA